MSLKEILDDAKDGRLKKSSVAKLEELVEDKRNPTNIESLDKAEKYVWEYKGEKYNGLKELVKKTNVKQHQVSNFINKGEINRIG